MVFIGEIRLIIYESENIREIFRDKLTVCSEEELLKAIFLKCIPKIERRI